MLTFSFSGAEGSMTESEILTSGMVGKEILLSFDASWNNLTKTLVFRAGEVTRVVLNPGATATIPEDVLKRPFCKLYVGAYGTDEEGTLVIPTIMVEGPLIRYGADPIEDETAEELPVWQNLQNQIGDPALLETDSRTDLVAAVNELHRADRFMGLATDLETLHKDSLTGAVNEIHQELGELAQKPPLPPDVAQLLVDILSQSIYQEDQYQNISALAAAFGVQAPDILGDLVAYWDFRSGSLVDLVGGLEAVATEDITTDAEGAHTATASSYLTVPLGQDGASLAGNYIEIKFGTMTLLDTGTTMRLITANGGKQPASSGPMWVTRGCWVCKLSGNSEFTDMQMFSGKTVIGRPNEDASQILWYLDEVYLGPSNPGYTPTHVSLGCSMNAAYPITVEYIKIHPQQ